jgi:hypothetical protein
LLPKTVGIHSRPETERKRSFFSMERMRRSSSPVEEGRGKLKEAAERAVTWIVRVMVARSDGRTRPERGEMCSQEGRREVEPGLLTKDQGAMTFP